MKKSYIRNAALDSIRTIFGLLFPILTFPYASRVIHVDNLGKINFGNSIVSYFSLIAALGISSYAIREGVAVRDDSNKLQKLASEVFTINIISTIISYLLLFLYLFTSSKASDYKELILIQSSIILFTTIGISWINNIFEDFLFITLRTIGFQILSMILLYICVKREEDYLLYAIITVISQSGANILNWIHSRKYVHISIRRYHNIKRHIKPILILFGSSVASMIYLNSDTTMLGYMTKDYNVGLYSVAVKIYVIAKSFFTSFVMVSLPRATYYISNKYKDEFETLTKKIFQFLCLLLVPSSIGLFIFSETIVHIVGGKEYIDGTQALRLLSISLVFSILATFVTFTLLLPLKKEAVVLKASIVAALVNIGLNLILIPLMKQNGAALTTIIAEFLVFMIEAYCVKEYMRKLIDRKFLITLICGNIAVIITCCIEKILISNQLLELILSIISSCFIYIIILFLGKNKLVSEAIYIVKNKFHKEGIKE